MMMAIVAACAFATGTAAQTVAVELRAGAAVGNYSETAAGLEWAPGPSLGLEAQLALTPVVDVYAGFTRSSFGCEAGFCTEQAATLTAQGVTAGARWAGGLPWIRAGLAWQSLDLDAVAGSGSGDAGLGFDLGAGIEVGLGRTFLIRPGLTYRRVGTTLDADDGHVATFALEIGVAASLSALGL